jgi:hypothetical protein
MYLDISGSHGGEDVDRVTTQKTTINTVKGTFQ